MKRRVNQHLLAIRQTPRARKPLRNNTPVWCVSLFVFARSGYETSRKPAPAGDTTKHLGRGSCSATIRPYSVCDYLEQGGRDLLGYTRQDAGFCHAELHPRCGNLYGAFWIPLTVLASPAVSQTDGTIHPNAYADVASNTPIWCMTVFGKECTGLMYVQESWGITCAVAAVSPKGRRHQLQVSP